MPECRASTGGRFAAARTLLHTVYVGNDNDFTPDVSGPNQFFVFGATDADLHAIYQAQQLSTVPLPKSLALFGGALGLFGLVGWRRKAQRA